MTTPHISAPVLVSPAQLRSNPALTTQIRLLINDAFRRSKLDKPEKWDFAQPRFETNDSYYETLGDDAVVALIFDRDAVSARYDEPSRGAKGEEAAIEGGEFTGKVIACAGAIPWKGGWRKEGAGTEEGWEVKAIAVHEDEKYLHKGLAVKAMQKLEEWAIEKKKMERPDAQRGCVTLWLLVAECINGVYWKKRGYQKVRSSIEGNGTWGCKTSFEMVVYRKDVEFGLRQTEKSP